MKLSPTTNAALWAILGCFAFIGVPMTLLRPGALGFLPILTSVVAGIFLMRAAYSQWRDQKIIFDFMKLAPVVIAGAGFAFFLAALGRQFS